MKLKGQIDTDNAFAHNNIMEESGCAQEIVTECDIILVKASGAIPWKKWHNL